MNKPSRELRDQVKDNLVSLQYNRFGEPLQPVNDNVEPVKKNTGFGSHHGVVDSQFGVGRQYGTIRTLVNKPDKKFIFVESDEGGGKYKNLFSPPHHWEHLEKYKKFRQGARVSFLPAWNQKKQSWNAHYLQLSEADFAIKLDPKNDRHAVNQALKSKKTLPEKLKQALGGLSLWVNEQGNFVVEPDGGRNGSTATTIAIPEENRLLEILQRNGTTGWVSWLQGEPGWVLDCKKDVFIQAHRELHDFYMSTIRKLRQEHKHNLNISKHLDSLYYSFGAMEILMEGGNGSGGGGGSDTMMSKNRELLWTKVLEKGTLQTAVLKVRPFLELLKLFCTHDKYKWDDIPWLAVGTTVTTLEDRQRRLKSIGRCVSSLLRSSDYGPDVPVHWAAHPAVNNYPRSVVTPDLMTELVSALAFILANLFIPVQLPLDKPKSLEEAFVLISLGRQEMESSLNAAVEDLVHQVVTGLSIA